jgi:hypothetical protein
VAPATTTRHLVDQLNAFGLQVFQRSSQIVDLVRKMMQAFAPVGEETADRRLLIRWCDELQEGVPQRQHGLFDALVLDLLAVAHLDAPDLPIVGDGGVEIGHREGNVFDLVGHRRRS